MQPRLEQFSPCPHFLLADEHKKPTSGRPSRDQRPCFLTSRAGESQRNPPSAPCLLFTPNPTLVPHEHSPKNGNSRQLVWPDSPGTDSSGFACQRAVASAWPIHLDQSRRPDGRRRIPGRHGHGSPIDPTGRDRNGGIRRRLLLRYREPCDPQDHAGRGGFDLRRNSRGRRQRQRNRSAGPVQVARGPGPRRRGEFICGGYRQSYHSQSHTRRRGHHFGREHRARDM